MQVLEKLVSRLSVTPTCPACQGVIPSEDVNVGNDIAFCRACNLSHRLSALTHGTVMNAKIDVTRPPTGVQFHRDGRGTIITASHRSLGTAIGTLLICLFWNGIVSVFVLVATVATLHNLGVTVPVWFPAPPMTMPVGMNIFLWLFLIPFITVGSVMFATFVSAVAGHTELRVEGGQVSLFSGIGPIGLRKRFSVSEVRDVRIENKNCRNSDGDSQRKAHIIIETDRKPISCGSMLNDERRQFFAAAAKRELIRTQPSGFTQPRR